MTIEVEAGVAQDAHAVLIGEGRQKVVQRPVRLPGNSLRPRRPVDVSYGLKPQVLDAAEIQHIGVFEIVIKDAGEVLHPRYRGNGTVSLAFFDLVQPVAGRCTERFSYQRPVSQCTRAYFPASLHPREHCSAAKPTGHLVAVKRLAAPSRRIGCAVDNEVKPAVYIP